MAEVPNQKWLADLTYVPTDEGWLYVALVLDLFARKIVALALGHPVGQPLGWSMSDTMPQELTLGALWVALGWRVAVRNMRPTITAACSKRAASPFQ